MIEPALSIAASLFSIAAAVFAFYEAKKARSAASEAEKVRLDLINRKALAELSHLLQETRRILQSVSRIGPAASEGKMRGVNCVEIAEDVQGFCRLLNEHSHDLRNLGYVEAVKLRDELIPEINALSAARTFADKKAVGGRIYDKIDGLAPLLKTFVDARQSQDPAISERSKK